MGKPRLIECSFTFVDEDPSQYIEVAVVDEGGGPFWVIKTDRWAFDDLKEFTALLSSVVGFIQDNMK